MNKSRKNQFIFRLSDPEKEWFLDKVSRSGLSQQKYVLYSVLAKDIISIDRAELQKISMELSRQGNNLNQIARTLNSRGYVDYKNTIPELEKELKKTWQQLRQLIQKLP